MTLGKCSLSVWFSTQNFLYTVLESTTPLWVCIFKQFTHLVSLGIFYKCQKIAMWAWSYVWNLILALPICHSHLQLLQSASKISPDHTTTSPGQCIIRSQHTLIWKPLWVAFFSKDSGTMSQNVLHEATSSSKWMSLLSILSSPKIMFLCNFWFPTLEVENKRCS